MDETPRAAPLPPERPKARPKIDRIEIGDPTARRNERKQALDAVSGRLDLAPAAAPETPEPAGAEVLGVEPQEAVATLIVTVREGAFDLRAFGNVTLLAGGAAHLFRYAGTARAPIGLVALTLRAADPGEVAAAAADFLRGGGGRLLAGVHAG